MRKWMKLVSLMLLTGCGRDAPFKEPDTSTPAPDAGTQAKTDHLGAWYGQGREFPDGELCMLLCDNGRAFLGDRLCTDTAAGDFQGYFTFTRTGDVLTFNQSAQSAVLTISIRSLSGDTGTFIYLGNDLPMSRTAATSPLCTDPARTPY